VYTTKVESTEVWRHPKTGGKVRRALYAL